MRKISACLISQHISANCERCGKRMEVSVHIYGPEDQLLCIECCPEHSAPLLKGVL